MKVRCKNCRLEFKADDRSRVSRCPRCDSDRLDITRDPLPDARIESRPGDTQIGAASSANPTGLMPAGGQSGPTSAESQAGVKPAFSEAAKVYSSAGSIVYGDTKAAWQSYHNTSGGSLGCPHCGNTSFEFNYKRKEKICKKCGEILPLPRRMA